MKSILSMRCKISIGQAGKSSRLRILKMKKSKMVKVRELNKKRRARNLLNRKLLVSFKRRHRREIKFKFCRVSSTSCSMRMIAGVKGLLMSSS